MWTPFEGPLGPNLQVSTEPGQLQTWLWVLGGAMIYLLLPLYFPTGQLLSPRWRWITYSIVLLATAGILISATHPGTEFVQVQDARGSITNPFGIDALQPPDVLAGSVDVALSVLLFGILCATTASLFLRLRRSRGIERQQMKWFVLASAQATIVSAAMGYYPPLGLATGVVLISIPATIGVAIIRHDLYDIDIILNRTLVYGALTAGVVGGYVLIVGGLGFVLHGRLNLLVSLVATGVVAILFQPLRSTLQRRVNRLLYGERDNPYAVLARLGQRLEGALTPDSVLPGIVETICQALRLPYAAIALRHGDELVIAAAAGTPVTDPPRLPLVYGHEKVGELLLGPRRPGESFTSADRRLLDDLARQIGVAAHAVRLTGDLQRSRELLVAAREEERRRLRRDLHDGLGPEFASLTLQADAARDLVDSDPQMASALLSDLIAQLQEATADIRRLVHELRPPALDDLGLVGAVRAHTLRHEHGGLRVCVEATDPMPPLPAAVEVAAYRIVQEALANVARHAGATHCAVRIVANGQLQVEIEDDGAGIADDYESGVGLLSMRERAAELGGACIIERRQECGTRVRATLPFSDIVAPAR